MDSKGALKIQKPNGQKQKKRKKNKVKFSAHSKRTLNSRNWRKSQFHRKLFHKNQKPGFKRGKVLQRKKGAKRRHTYFIRKGLNAYGVNNTVPICYKLWWKEKRKRLFIKLHVQVTEEKRYSATRKWEEKKEKKRRKKFVGAIRRRICLRRKMKGCKIYNPRWKSRVRQAEEKHKSRDKVRIMMQLLTITIWYNLILF